MGQKDCIRVLHYKAKWISRLRSLEDNTYGFSLVLNLYHFSLTENHLPRRRRLRRVAIPNSHAVSLLGRDLREAHLQVLLGSGGYQSCNTTASNAVTDSLLSSLVLNFPTSEVEEPVKSTSSSAENCINKKTTPLQTWKSR